MKDYFNIKATGKNIELGSFFQKYNIKKQTFVKTNKAFHGTKEPENIGKPTSMGCNLNLISMQIHYNCNVNQI